MKVNWDQDFVNCEDEAKKYNQKTASLVVANFCPPGAGARNIWQEDKKLVLEAARNNGFNQMNEGKYVSFLKNLV